MTRFFILASLASVLLWAAATGAADVGGKTRVIDGRTIEVGGQRFRLYGIDAPDLDQTCRWPNKTILCGQMSKTAMMDLVAQAEVVCSPLADAGKNATAGPGIRFARCRASGFDIGNNMIHTGWALAYRPDTSPYVVTQDKARKARRGMWKGTFDLPWKWRRNH